MKAILFCLFFVCSLVFAQTIYPYKSDLPDPRNISIVDQSIIYQQQANNINGPIIYKLPLNEYFPKPRSVRFNQNNNQYYGDVQGTIFKLKAPKGSSLVDHEIIDNPNGDETEDKIIFTCEVSETYALFDCTDFVLNQVKQRR